MARWRGGAVRGARHARRPCGAPQQRRQGPATLLVAHTKPTFCRSVAPRSPTRPAGRDLSSRRASEKTRIKTKMPLIKSGPLTRLRATMGPQAVQRAPWRRSHCSPPRPISNKSEEDGMVGRGGRGPGLAGRAALRRGRPPSSVSAASTSRARDRRRRRRAPGSRGAQRAAGLWWSRTRPRKARERIHDDAPLRVLRPPRRLSPRGREAGDGTRRFSGLPALPALPALLVIICRGLQRARPRTAKRLGSSNSSPCRASDAHRLLIGCSSIALLSTLTAQP